jgi:hypothetical protein
LCRTSIPWVSQIRLPAGYELNSARHSIQRIQKVQDALQTGMKKALVGALTSFIQDPNNAGAVASLTQCLRTYALIDRTILAEDVIREILFEPFLAKLVTPSSLNFDPLLPIGVRPLQNLYQRILDFTTQEFLPLLEITERTLKGTPFQMLTNVVWVAVASSIQQHLSIIFSPGIPDAFHENFTMTLDFVARLEAFAPDLKALRYLRAHGSYVEFMRRWQAPVYFQIRFTSITTAFEDHVSRATLETLTRSLETLDLSNLSDGRLLLPVSQALLDAINTSWADDVWLFSLSFRFWKLTLQCIGRYAVWLQTLTEGYRSPGSRPGSPTDVNGDSTTGVLVVPTTPPLMPPGELSDDEEQTMLNLLAILSYEIKALSGKVRHLFAETIRPKLPGAILENSVLESK